MDDYKTCGSCKTRTHLSEFKVKKGLTLKTCNRCLEYKKIINDKNKCEHQRRRSDCIECGGASICEHQRQRRTCKECGGSSICEHQRQRIQCKECNGASICEHQRERNKCKECTDPIHVIIRQWIRNCKQSDIKHNRYNEQEFITYEFCQKLIEDSHHLCCYCSIPLQTLIYQPDLMTIERIDNSIGHMIGNCTIACYHCNVAKVGQHD